MLNSENNAIKNVSDSQLHVEVIGAGPDLVLLHGWGLNSACWQNIVPQLSEHYRLHLVDLPGFGLSHESFSESQSLADIASALAAVTPENATWLGWSLGGLCASYFALHYPQRVNCLITVASSPKFMAQEQGVNGLDWPGIKPEVLSYFNQQLVQNLPATINRFLAIQAMGSLSAKQDIKELKRLLSLRPEPHIEALTAGLKLLETVDLRDDLLDLTMPFYRFYGRLDTLVPQPVVELMQTALPRSGQHVFQQSSHAPFISEPDNFVMILREFLQH